MGIPAYFSKIIKDYNIIFKNLNDKLQCHNFFLDSNSIIYDIIHSLDDNETNNMEELETYIINKVCIKINYYIKLINPINKVYIMFDGVAPMAKIYQQKNRRYKSYITNNINTSNINTSNIKWDTSAITPGTKFMKKLSTMINNYFKKKNNIIISCSLSPGEGEHKIFSLIRNSNIKGNTIIYGLDSDLIMLALYHLNYNNTIYLYRETPEYIKSLNKNLDPNTKYILDIPKLKHIIEEFIPINDYMFICFLLGNDFIPHHPSFNIRTNGMHDIIGIYKQYIAPNTIISNSMTISWNIFRKYIEKLAKIEYNNLKNEHYRRDKLNYSYSNKNITKTQMLENIPIIERNDELYIDPLSDNWQYRYYRVLFDIDYDNKEHVKKICINYLESLEWTFKYYINSCPDWNWKYNYHYTPLFSDLIKYIPHFFIEFIQNTNTTPINPNLQLLYVIPESSSYLIPEHIRKQLYTTFPDYYRNDHKIIWCYCRYLWEAHIKFKYYDIKKLKNIIINIELNI